MIAKIECTIKESALKSEDAALLAGIVARAIPLNCLAESKVEIIELQPAPDQKPADK